MYYSQCIVQNKLFENNNIAIMCLRNVYKILSRTLIHITLTEHYEPYVIEI